MPESFDKITKQELEQHMTDTYPILPNHTLSAIILLNLSPKGYWDQYLDDNAPFWLGKFYEQKGEKRIENGEWTEPEE